MFPDNCADCIFANFKRLKAEKRFVWCEYWQEYVDINKAKIVFHCCDIWEWQR